MIDIRLGNLFLLFKPLILYSNIKQHPTLHPPTVRYYLEANNGIPGLEICAVQRNFSSLLRGSPKSRMQNTFRDDCQRCAGLAVLLLSGRTHFWGQLRHAGSGKVATREDTRWWWCEWPGIFCEMVTKKLNPVTLLFFCRMASFSFISTIGRIRLWRMASSTSVRRCWLTMRTFWEVEHWTLMGGRLMISKLGFDRLEDVLRETK